MLYEPKFQISDIANATGVKPETIRQWYKRGTLFVRADSDREAEGVGLPRYFSAATAVMIGIMGQLTAVGVSPKNAARAALGFAHTGDETRNPCQLFAGNGSETWLVSAASFQFPRIVEVKTTTSFLDVTYRGLPDAGLQTAIVTLPLDELVVSVVSRLGVDRGYLWNANVT